MAADLNRVTLVGRLTRDPEVRRTPGGDPVCSLRLAVSSRARGDDGAWADRGNFFDVTVFGRQAEALGAHLAKGRRVGVDGRLAWREWQARDGTRRQGVEVIASDVVFLDGRRPADEGWGGGEDAPATDGAGEPPLAAVAGGGDDIPF